MLELLKKSVFFIVIIVAIVIFLFVTKDDDVEENDSEFNSIISTPSEINDQTTSTQSEMKAIVDVKGEVMKPGVYEMDTDSRVNDVIQTAGGFTPDADQSQVNLAQKVQDELIIVIPKNGDSETNTGTISEEPGKIRLNYATQEEIESLNGIGPSKAQAIIQHREEYGMFRTIEDLLEVSGIGQKTLDNIRDSIQVP